MQAVLKLRLENGRASTNHQKHELNVGDVVKLTVGRAKAGRAIPKPVDCKDCGEPIETARLQALAGSLLKPTQCISCARAWERRFERQMQAVREHQAVEIIR
jgi:RNA polymerase-binding transcription factor DksA